MTDSERDAMRRRIEAKFWSIANAPVTRRLLTGAMPSNKDLRRSRSALAVLRRAGLLTESDS